MITQFTEVLHRLGIKTVLNRKHRTNPRPARRRAKSFASLFKGCGFSGQRPESRSAERETPLLKPGVRPGFQLNPRFKARPQTRNSPARQARSWKTNPTVGFPLSPPLLRTLFPVRPHFGRRSWNPFLRNGFPHPHPYCAPSPLSDRTLGEVQRKRPPFGAVFS